MLALNEPRCWGHAHIVAGKLGGEKFCPKRNTCWRKDAAANDPFNPDVPKNAVIPIAQYLCWGDETCAHYLPMEAR